ncbi:MAG: hypothetical protein OES09_12960, partial [Gammaproteobacteria bacterium]|nr:hypothetical protein [Gammaproteobacteria bacterium]
MPSANRESEDFYVGYHKKMPSGLARFVSRTVAVLLLAVAALAFAVPSLHRAYDFARNDFRDTREFEGVFLAQPAPHLVIVRPGETGAHAFSRYLLVGRGKSGPKIDTESLSGKHVRIRGSLIYRDAQTLISVKSGEEIPAPASGFPAEPSGGASIGKFTLQGEIVDSKCYFGTMRPGHGSVHRACAIRCIAGGIPPVFVIRDDNDNRMSFMLIDADGSDVNKRVLPFVADPLEITGEVIRM